jgi:hypothetical protein
MDPFTDPDYFVRVVESTVPFRVHLDDRFLSPSSPRADGSRRLLEPGGDDAGTSPRSRVISRSERDEDD